MPTPAPHWPRIQPAGRPKPIWWYRLVGRAHVAWDRLRLLAVRAAPHNDPALLAALLLLQGALMAHPPPASPDAPVQAAINVFAYVAVLIVSALISYALAPKPPVPPSAALSDFSVPTAEEGREIGVAFGEVLDRSPNVLWFGDLGSTPIRKKAGK